MRGPLTFAVKAHKESLRSLRSKNASKAPINLTFQTHDLFPPTSQLVIFFTAIGSQGGASERAPRQEFTYHHVSQARSNETRERVVSVASYGCPARSRVRLVGPLALDSTGPRCVGAVKLRVNPLVANGTALKKSNPLAALLPLDHGDKNELLALKIARRCVGRRGHPVRAAAPSPTFTSRLSTFNQRRPVYGVL